jgi:D-alanyl-D-alanine carboxypeptidase (penicillin-binding protein 5/6)
MMKAKLISFLLIISILVPALSVRAFCDDVSDVAPDSGQIEAEYNPGEQIKPENLPESGCRAVYAADPDTGKVFYEKNAHEKMYPASTTKILTALLVLENCSLTEKAKVSQNALDRVPAGYSSARLRAGEEFDIETLLSALLIPSANEAANVLAEHVGGSIETFVDMCNKRAKELGCEILHFVNPNGIHDDNHYCSAYDLYLIAKECRRYEAFNRIVASKSFTVPATDVYPRADRVFNNTDEMLLPGRYFCSYCTGIKTGHTKPAGECFVGSAYSEDTQIISVVLGGSEYNSRGLNDRFDTTKQIYEFIYGNYSNRRILSAGDVFCSIEVGKAEKETASLDLIADRDIYSFIPDTVSPEDIKTSAAIRDGITAPLDKGTVLGTLTVSADGLVYKAYLVASHDVEKLPYARYNLIIAAVFLLTAAVLALILSKSKKNRKPLFYLSVAIIVFEILCFVISGIRISGKSETRFPQDFAGEIVSADEIR